MAQALQGLVAGVLGGLVYSKLGSGGVENSLTGRQAELERMSARIESMMGEMGGRSRQAPAMVVSWQSDNLASSILRGGQVLLLGVGGVSIVWVYLKWQGLSFGDVCYVTVKTFKAGLEGVHKTLAEISERVIDVYQQLTGQIQEVDGKVEAGLRMAHETQVELGRVRNGVDDLAQNLESVQAGVDRCEARLVQADAKHGYIHRGMHLLCTVVSEVLLPSSTNKDDSSAINSLQDFVKTVPQQVPAPFVHRARHMFAWDSENERWPEDDEA